MPIENSASFAGDSQHFTPLNEPRAEHLNIGGIEIALRHRAAADAIDRPPLFWLSGYRSDMEGIKAEAVDAFAEAHGRSCTRFDYSGHGQSGGDFMQGTISLWLSQALAVYDHFYRNAAAAPIIIGSSMGGWIGLRLAQELQKRGKPASGLVLLAPAPDFTETLVKPQMQPEHYQQLAEQGYFTSAEGGYEMPYSRALLEDGINNRIMGTGLLKLGCPVRIMQGMADETVPYSHTLQLMDFLPLENVTLTLVKDGDHRLSRPQDIVFLQNLLENVTALV